MIYDFGLISTLISLNYPQLGTSGWSEGKDIWEHPHKLTIPDILRGHTTFHDHRFRIYEFGLISV